MHPSAVIHSTLPVNQKQQALEKLIQGFILGFEPHMGYCRSARFYQSQGEFVRSLVVIGLVEFAHEGKQLRLTSKGITLHTNLVALEKVQLGMI